MQECNTTLATAYTVRRRALGLPLFIPGSPANRRFDGVDFTGKPKADKLRGLGQSPRANLLYYAMLSVIKPHMKHASSLAIAVAATFLFVLFFNVSR